MADVIFPAAIRIWPRARGYLAQTKKEEKKESGKDSARANDLQAMQCAAGCSARRQGAAVLPGSPARISAEEAARIQGGAWQVIKGGGEMKQTFILPWPDRRLSPNARCHWAQKAVAAKKARRDAYYAALEAGYGPVAFAGYDGQIHLWIEFYPKTRNRPDDDNCLAAIKSHTDGIADALRVNDSRFVRHARVMDETGGKIIVRLTRDT